MDESKVFSVVFKLKFYLYIIYFAGSEVAILVDRKLMGFLFD